MVIEAAETEVAIEAIMREVEAEAEKDEEVDGAVTTDTISRVADTVMKKMRMVASLKDEVVVEEATDRGHLSTTTAGKQVKK